MTMTKHFKAAYLGWAFIALFYCYQYILRVTPGIITDELRHTFLMSAEEFATLGAYYLYAYAFLQIPLGFIVDRIGVKKTVLTSMLLCISGTMLLAYTDKAGIAQLSRLLVGCGSACAFMSSLKWIADHFPEGKRGFLMGATLTLGTVGALSAGTILVNLVEHMGWRTAIIFTGWLGIALYILIAFLLQDGKPAVSEKLEITKIGKNLLEVIKIKNVLIYGALATGLYTPLSVLADLWGVSFLAQKFACTRAEAAGTVMFIYIGLAAGCLTIPSVAERYKAFSATLRIASIILLAIFSIIMFVDVQSTFVLKILFLGLGFFGGAEMICFTGAVLHSVRGQSGLTIGVVNTMNMLGGAVLEQMIGKALDIQWNGAVDAAGMRLYSTSQYANALTLPLGIILLCVVLSFILREKKA